MASFRRSTTPIIPTRQMYAASRRFNKEKITLEFFLFSHVNSDIIELLVKSVDNGPEYEHVFFSRKAILQQVDAELVARFEVARATTSSGETGFQSEEALQNELTSEMIGEFVMDQISIDPNDYSKLVVAPITDGGTPIHIVALKPQGISELDISRIGFDGSSSEKSSWSQEELKPSDSCSPAPAAHYHTRRPSLILRAVDAFKASVAHRDSSEIHRAEMHPAKRRLHRSVKKVMLQNAVEKVRTMLGRPPSAQSGSERDSSRTPRPGSTGSIGNEMKSSSLETAREEMAIRKKPTSASAK